MNCRECRFWNLNFPDFRAIDENRLPDEAPIGRCQVEDPSRWKLTREIDWCGRFEPAAVAAPAADPLPPQRFMTTSGAIIVVGERTVRFEGRMDELPVEVFAEARRWMQNISPGVWWWTDSAGERGTVQPYQSRADSEYSPF